MRKPKVLLWRPMYDPGGQRKLEAAGARVQVVDSPLSADVMAALDGTDALWARYPQEVSAEVLGAGADLAVVSTSGFGYDKIDVEAATRLGILVVNNQGFGRVPVSEHTLLLILASMKRLMWSDAATRDGTAWDARAGLPIFELEGKTVGIVGLGWVGAELARKLRCAFHCRVLGYDPYVDPRIPLLADVERFANLDAMLAESEILCLCPELTDSSRNLIGAAELARLPAGAFLVNTARGQVLDLDAVVPALDAGQLAGAAMDVFEPEPPPPGHPVLGDARVVLTPHTAGLTAETSVRITDNAVGQIMMAVRGDFPPFALNREAWESPQSRRPRPNTEPDDG